MLGLPASVVRCPSSSKNAQPQGHARSHRRHQGDAEDHQGHADGGGLEVAARAGGGRGRASLRRAHGKGARQYRGRGRRPRQRAEAAPRHRQRGRTSAGGLHRRARPVRAVQLGDRAARARAGQHVDGRGQGGQVLLRRSQGLRAAPPPLPAADHRAHRAARGPHARLRARRRDRRQDRAALRGGRVRRLQPVLLTLQVGHRAGSDCATAHSARVRGRSPATVLARPTSTSPTRTRFWPSFCRATSRCRFSARSWRMPPRSTARR